MPGADFLIIGGGVMGVNIAAGLKRRYPDAEVVLLEKEDRCGRHASGRNSGVLHAGFYYSADSLKARFAREGNRLMSEYCEARGLPLRRCGKLVVARNEAEDAVLDELMRRGQRNGVPLQLIDRAEMRDIEPRARTWRRAIFSPTTASVSPARVMASMEREACEAGVRIHCGVRYLGREAGGIRTSAGRWSARFVINSAGLYADKVAHEFGFGHQFRILPFKGLYLKSAEPPGSLHTNVYPVPDLAQPFLGVHFTVQADGSAKLGPTAIPALWREQYNGYHNFRLDEFMDIGLRTAALIAGPDAKFKRLAWSELRKYSKRHLVGLAASLLEDVKPQNFHHWAVPGIRAQLFDVRKRALEMDFVLEGDERSLHVLNAVSPGWTCAIPFANYVCDEITRRVH